MHFGENGQRNAWRCNCDPSPGGAYNATYGGIFQIKTYYIRFVLLHLGMNDVIL